MDVLLRMCILRNEFLTESARHLILHYQHVDDTRQELIAQSRQMTGCTGGIIFFSLIFPFFIILCKADVFIAS